MQIQDDDTRDDDLEISEVTDFSRAVRGKYADRFKGMVRAVALEADVAEVFQTSEQVNQALRFLIELNKTTDALLTAANQSVAKRQIAEEPAEYNVNKSE